MAIENWITYNCLVKRHLISTSSHEHGRPAETEPDRTIFTQGKNVAAGLLDVKKHIVSFRNSFAAFYLLITVTVV